MVEVCVAANRREPPFDLPDDLVDIRPPIVVHRVDGPDGLPAVLVPGVGHVLVQLALGVVQPPA